MATVRSKFRYSSLLDAGVAPCQIRVTINIAIALSDAIREVKPGRRDGLGACPGCLHRRSNCQSGGAIHFTSAFHDGVPYDNNDSRQLCGRLHLAVTGHCLFQNFLRVPEGFAITIAVITPQPTDDRLFR